MENLRSQRKTFTDRYSYFLSTITEQIRTGVLTPGDHISTENDLCQQFRLSHGSVRKGLAALASDGLITKLRRKGYVVTRPASIHLVKSKRISLGVYVPNDDLVPIRHVVNEFERCIADVKVQIVLLQSRNYVDILTEMAENNNLPDVILITDRQLRRMKSDCYLYDITSHVSEISERLFAPVECAFAIRQHLYALPFAFSPVVFCINKFLFDKFGLPYPDEQWSWADVLAAAQRMTHVPAVGKPIEHYGLQVSPHPNRLGVFLIQNEASLVDDDGKPNIDNKAVVEAIEYYVNCMYRYCVCPVFSNSRASDASILFTSGRIAMQLASYIEINEYQNLHFPWAIVPPMHGRSTGTVLISIGLAISKNTTHIQEALQFVKFMASKHAQTIVKTKSTTLPALRSIASDRNLLPENRCPEGYYTFEKVLPYSKSLSACGDHWLDFLFSELTLALNNMESPADACHRIQKRAIEIYNKNADMKGK